MLDGAEKNLEDERALHKSALKAVQDDLEKAKSDAATADEARKKEIEDLKTEDEKLQSDKNIELSQAFSASFAAYLENFLSADPDYNWSLHFAPSTPGFMVDFKAKHSGL